MAVYVRLSSLGLPKLPGDFRSKSVSFFCRMEFLNVLYLRSDLSERLSSFTTVFLTSKYKGTVLE